VRQVVAIGEGVAQLHHGQQITLEIDVARHVGFRDAALVERGQPREGLAVPQTYVETRRAVTECDAFAAGQIHGEGTGRLGERPLQLSQKRVAGLGGRDGDVGGHVGLLPPAGDSTPQPSPPHKSRSKSSRNRT
jgi:hypothetical protein